MRKRYSSVSEMVRATCSKELADALDRRLKRRAKAKQREIEGVLTAASAELRKELGLTLKELAERVAEQNQRKSSNAAALAEARKEIQERGRFVPKVDPLCPVEICF
jgi:hypothetical protein